MNIDICNNFIINPTIEVTPSIRISPFMESDLAPFNADVEIAREYLLERFHNYLFTIKARDAISLALSYYGLLKDDVVTILTTSNNYYISGCVTKEIEKHCLWSREISNRTKLLFVNHEFGYPFEELESLKKYGIPIIEDCAHTFMSKDNASQIGKIGDFVIYSLPKFFPMQIGGILVSDKLNLSFIDNQISFNNQYYILNHLSMYLPSLNNIVERRISNYMYLTKKLTNIGISPFFPLRNGIVPGVFLFKWDDDIDYSLLKVFMQKNGVESSVFYGKSGFFIPTHHKLEKYHLDYMINLLKYFRNDFC